MAEPATSRFSAAFRVDGLPKAQPRPRAFARRFAGRYTARLYDPGTAENWKACVVAAGRPLRPRAPLQGPLAVRVEFAFPRPKRLAGKKSPDGPVPHTAKPDADNLAKSTLDCLTADGWWLDDAQVCRLIVAKTYAARNQRTGALIRVRSIR